MEQDLATDLLVLQSHLDGMIGRVQQNSATLRKFQAFEMGLLNLNTLADVIDHLLEDARVYFDLDAVSLCLIDEKGEIAAILDEDGYASRSKKGLILLDNKELLTKLFGFVIRPYIGLYDRKICAGLFSHGQKEPASVAITPLKRRGKYLGTLNLGSYHADRFADTMATDFVEHLVSVVGVCLENNLNFETIKRTSYIDTLTGVNNRRFLELRIIEEIDRCQRNKSSISCLFLDIDFFKMVNDQHGHQAGDLVLYLVANTIKNQLRNNDVLVRYGGEEFVVLLSETSETRAVDIAERIRKAIQALVIEFNDQSILATVSIGLSTYVPDVPAAAGDIAGCLIKSADSALYKAKRQGRNRVQKGKFMAVSFNT